MTMELNESSIEEIVCKPLEGKSCIPMDKETTSILVALLMSESKPIPDKEKPFLYQLIEKRIQHCFTFTVDDTRLILFLSIVAKSPGTAIIYLWYMQYWCKKNRIVDLTLELFCEAFPAGFPSYTDIQDIWRKQKVALSPDNLVDHTEYGKSLMNPK